VLGLNKAAKYYYTTGWHEPCTVTEFAINKAAWESLPADLQAIVYNACATTNLLMHSEAEAVNATALDEMVATGTETRVLPADVVAALHKEMEGVYAELASGDPVFAKVMKSYFDFKKTHDKWAQISEEVWHSQLRNA
jgi:TRAP-type mannitol/chloroaromatic compound transport system substrate-binding protein